MGVEGRGVVGLVFWGRVDLVFGVLSMGEHLPTEADDINMEAKRGIIHTCQP